MSLNADEQRIAAQLAAQRPGEVIVPKAIGVLAYPTGVIVDFGDGIRFLVPPGPAQELAFALMQGVDRVLELAAGGESGDGD